MLDTGTEDELIALPMPTKIWAVNPVAPVTILFDGFAAHLASVRTPRFALALAPFRSLFDESILTVSSGEELGVNLVATAVVELQILPKFMGDPQSTLKLFADTTLIAGEVDVLCSNINHMGTSTFISDQPTTFRIGAAFDCEPLDVHWIIPKPTRAAVSVGLGMLLRSFTFALGEKLLQKDWYVLQQIYKAADWFELLRKIRKAAQKSGLRVIPC